MIVCCAFSRTLFLLSLHVALLISPLSLVGRHRCTRSFPSCRLVAQMPNKRLKLTGPAFKIGRASCRGRVEPQGGAVALVGDRPAAYARCVSQHLEVHLPLAGSGTP